MSLAERRHQSQRAKAKALKIGRVWNIESKWLTPKWVGKMANHRGALCSCPMCGNPRKWFKQRTLAELVFDDRFQDQKTELGDLH